MESGDEVFHKRLSTSVMYGAAGGGPQAISPTSRNPNALSKSLLKRFESVDGDVTYRQGSLVRELKERLTDVTEQLDKTHTEKEQMNKQLESSVQNLKTLEDERHRLKKDVADEKKGKVHLEGHLKAVKQELENAKKMLEKKTMEASGSDERLKHTEQKVAKMKREVEQANKAKEEMAKQFEQRSKEDDHTEHELEKQRVIVEKLTKELTEMRMLKEEAMGNLQKEKRTTSELTLKLSDLEIELKGAEDKAVQRQGDIGLLQEQYEDNKRKLQREVKAMREALHAREEELKLQRDQDVVQSDPRREEEQEMLLAENQSYRQQLSEVQTERERLQKEGKDLQKEKKKHTLRIQDRENTIQTLTKETKSLKKQVALIAKQCNQLKQQLKDGNPQSPGNHEGLQAVNGIPVDIKTEKGDNLQKESDQLKQILNQVQMEKADLHKQLEVMTENHCREMNKQNKKIASQLRYIEAMQSEGASSENIL